MGNTPWSNETERAEWYMREYESLRKRQEELPTGGQLIVKGAVLIEHEEETEDTPVKYIKKNKDDIEQAVKCLDEFTHNWCMNCKETDRQGDLVFRCNDGCPFIADNHVCLVKQFKIMHKPDCREFGCMGDL